MKKFLFYLLLAYAALTMQSLFFRGTKPDLVLVLVCVYSLKFGQVKGIVYAAATGLLLDTAGGLILGTHIISKSVAAILITSIRDNLIQWNMYVNTVMILILSVIDILLVYTCFKFFAKASFENMPWTIMLTQVIYTVAASVILYRLLKPQEEEALIKSEGY